MAEKRSGRTSQFQEAGAGTGRGAQRPTNVGASQPVHQGGGSNRNQGGRGWGPQSQQGRQGGNPHSGGYTQGQGPVSYQPRGRIPSQQYGGSPAVYQGRGSQTQGVPFQPPGGPFPEGGKHQDGGSMMPGRGYTQGQVSATNQQQSRYPSQHDVGGYNPGQARGINQKWSRIPSQQHVGSPAGSQGQGSQPQGMPFQQPSRPMLEGGKHQDGGSTNFGHGEGQFSGGASRPSPELHQATVALSQPTVAIDGTSFSTGSSSISSEPIPSKMLHQVQKLFLQEEGSSAEAIKPVPSSSKSMNFPLRPGKGTIGIKCKVKANHFSVQLPDKDLYQYDVTITPEVTSRSVNRLIINKLVKLYKDSHLGERLPAYDGRKGLYTAGPLPFDSNNFVVDLVDEDDGPNSLRRERQFRVAIKLAARPDLHHLELFLQGKQSDSPQQALQVLDIVLREGPISRNRCVSVGQSFYFPDLGIKQSLGEGLESWRGFYQSIRPTQMGLSLNIDMSTTAFIEPLPVIEFVAQILNRDVLPRTLSDADRVKIKKALRNVKVEVTHRGSMRRKYRISGLTPQATQELTFSDENGTMKHVVQYFKETYGFIIQHTTWPCLQVGNPQRPNYLPMEVCQIVEGQRYTKRLNEKQITTLLKGTCQRPRDREYAISKTVQHNAYNKNKHAEQFGIKINEELASVEARILPPPRLKYHDTGVEKDCLPDVGQWNMLKKKMVNGGNVNNWICIDFSRNDQAAREFCNMLAHTCRDLGMAFHPEPVMPTFSARPDQVEKALKARYHDCMAKLHPQQKELDLLIVIMQDRKGSLYGDLKRICETELGLVSQCCLTKHVFKKSHQYMVNVALKINVKVGGRNTVLVDALSRRIPLVSDRPTIIFGADVTHPHPGDDCNTSIAAVVASQDWPEVTNYAGLVRAQVHEELILDLQGMVKELLVSFYKATRRKPERILFYRDGVSEGQFSQVLLHEVDAIRKAWASLEPNNANQPPITFVVVQKRHHTRLFADNHANNRSVDRSGNILPGTVVDSKICHPTEFDFYLCSHAGIQGTSRPAHYHVLWDENNFTADSLQTLTNNLCYTYARCTRSVSVVPPAYYAHLAAFRARCYMEPEISDGGSVAAAAAAAGRGTRSQGANTAVRPLPAVKDKVKRVMFYC